MGFVLLIIIALLILLADGMIQSQEQTNQIRIDPIPSAENSLIRKAQVSIEHVPVLLEINSIKDIVSPCLEDVRSLCRKLGRIGITSLQRRRIETIVPHALEGKEVLWKLKVRAVRDKSCYFYPENISQGGHYQVKSMIFQLMQIGRIAFLKIDVREPLFLCTSVPSLDKVPRDIDAQHVRSESRLW